MVCYKIACAQYPIEFLPDWDAYEAKLTRWVAEAAGEGAALLVFPEYGAMELASLDPASAGDLQGSLASVSALLPQVDALHGRLAAQFGVYILAASAPAREEARDGACYVNRARLFAPNGKVGVQDKQIMTRFEAEEWCVSSGGPMRVFDTALGRIGVLICYDSEFPLLARAQVEAGAHLLLVPSCTDSMQGYWRVRLGCQARALEGQCYVAQAPTVGEALWSPAVDVNHGAAGLYCPPDAAMGPCPEDGVLVIGERGRPQWVYGEVDRSRVAGLRIAGAVLNTRDWGLQAGAVGLPAVEVVNIC